jgi:Putative DNA-binding domain
VTTEQTQPDRNAAALNEIAALVASRTYHSFSLRLEILRPNQFVTARMEFHEQTCSRKEPEVFRYQEVTLVSITNDVEAWQIARQLITGELEVFGIKLPCVFSYSGRQEEPYLTEWSPYPRDCFRFVGPAATQQPYSPRPLLKIGLPPYANLADAAARFVHQSHAAHSQITELNTFLITLPTKREIALAEWLPGELKVKFVPHNLPEYQFDLFFWGPVSVRESQSIKSPPKEVSVPVPYGTTTIVGHLLAPIGVVAQSFVLRAPYTFVGEATSSLSHEQQIRADILAGESENREMKAFFNSDQNKDMRDRVLDSAIAFANTSGGNIYVGVEDHGELSGNSKLVNTIKKGATPEECAREVSAKLRKYIIENTRPVIEITALEIRIGTEWVVRLGVVPSTQIVSTHTNHVFIRSGASNRIPGPDWFSQRYAVAGSDSPGLAQSY